METTNPTQNITNAKAATLEEFLALFDADLHSVIAGLLAREDVAGIVCYECLMFGSSNLGHRTAVIYGPACTSPNLEFSLAKHLNDLPSRREYPTVYYVKP